jgi:hypothetical protein
MKKKLRKSGLLIIIQLAIFFNNCATFQDIKQTKQQTPWL